MSINGRGKQFYAHQIGVEAYLYLYPLVTMEVTRRQATNVEAGKFPGRGPMNDFSHIPEFPAADFRIVVRPNFDTLYSSAWLDLSDGPVIVSAPATAGRYYLLPMMDMWTNVFFSPGWRTTGTEASSWALVPPRWDGALPDGVERIESPTRTVWVIGRTQTNGPADYDAVHQVQAGYKVTPLAAWGNDYAPTVTIDPTIDMNTEPLRQVNAMSAVEFFALGAELMKEHPRMTPTDHNSHGWPT